MACAVDSPWDDKHKAEIGAGGVLGRWQGLGDTFGSTDWRRCGRSSLSMGSAASKVPTNRGLGTHGDRGQTVMMNKHCDNGHRKADSKDGRRVKPTELWIWGFSPPDL